MAALTTGCRSAASIPDASPVVPVGVGTLQPDSLVLAVWPVFVRKTGEPADGITPSDSARQRAVANALAEVLRAPIVKLTRRAESTRAGPDSTVGTIGIVAIVVQPDSAYVDVTLVPSNSAMHGEWMYTAYRYHYRREQGRWSFVRREWLASDGG